MTALDLVIGITLMNAMPHFILGTWRQRMINAFGFGDRGNMVYGLLNYAVSLSLFLYLYGWAGLMDNGIYMGASIIVLIYFCTSWFWRRLFSLKEVSSKDVKPKN